MIIDGKAVARDIREDLKKRVKVLKEKGIVPKLAVILVGDNPASQTYVASKQKACGWVGIASEQILMPADTAQDELLSVIRRLNADESVHGILVQLPLPKQIDATAVINEISPDKDVDGFHPVNAGKLLTGQKCFEACTPKGVVELIKRSGTEIAGSHAVIIGRSNIVGKPLAALLLRENATVTVCHSRTKNLSEITKTADILVAAVGKCRMVTADMVKPGACVIDVGINRLEDGTLAGDVDYDGVSAVAGAITPVPGGVGPMTIAMLLNNTVEAAEQHE